MPQSYNLDQFKGAIHKGIARTNQWLVELPNIPGSPEMTASDLNLLCKGVTLPGRQIMSLDHTIGLKTVKIANGFATEDVNISFHVTNDYNIKKYFEAWQSLAVNKDTYELGYKKTYGKQVTIKQLARDPKKTSYTNNPYRIIPGGFDASDNEVIYTCVLEQAFPTTLNSIELNNDLDGLVEISLQLSYSDWRSI